MVNAARAAAQWETEQQAMEHDEKYNLTENKIREMEKQMQILRLEKELEKARLALGTLRKSEYDDANPNFAKQPGENNPPPAVAAGNTKAASPKVGGQPTPQQPQQSQGAAKPSGSRIASTWRILLSIHKQIYIYI